MSPVIYLQIRIMKYEELTPEMQEIIRQNQHLCLIAENMKIALDLGETRKSFLVDLKKQLHDLQKLGQDIDTSYSLLGHFGLIYYVCQYTGEVNDHA